MSEFERFRELQRRGASPLDAYRAARSEGMADVDAIRMLRTLFGLSLAQAKEAMVVGSGTASSLREHEQAVASALQTELDADER